MTTQRRTSPRKMRRYRLGQFDLEPYRALLKNLGWHAAEPAQRRLLALTSFNREEGVSTVASQLAITAAFDSTKVLLIDANEDHPSLHIAFNLNRRKGFTDYVRDGSFDVIRPTQIPNLSVMPFGIAPFEARLGMQFESLMEPILEQFDLVILDLPAISSGQTMLRWVPFLDCLMLVVCPTTTAQMASNADCLVRNAGGTFCGVVQNNI